MPPSEAAPGSHGLPAFGAQGFTAGALAEQGLLAAQGFAGAWDAHGLTGAQGFFGIGAQGFAMAQGFAAAGVAVPKIWEANWSEGPSKVMAKSQGRSEKSAPLSQCGPGSQGWKKRAKINARAMPLKR